MVEVTIDCRHAAPGEDAGAVPGLGAAAQGGGGPTPGGALVEHVSGVGVVDGVAPFGVVGVGGDLAGDVGDDRAVAGELTRVL